MGRKIQGVMPWPRLTVLAKLAIGFLAVVSLMLLVAGVAIRSQNQTAEIMGRLLDEDIRIEELSLRTNAAMQKARRYEKDFLRRYRELGFVEARTRYANLVQMQLADIQRYLHSIQQLTRDTFIQLEAVDIEHAVSRYDASFDAFVGLYKQLGDPDTGLEARMARQAEALRDRLERPGLESLAMRALKLRQTELSYLLRSQDRDADLFRKEIAAFKEDEKLQELPADARRAVIGALDEYARLFERYVQTIEKIETNGAAYLTELQSIEPALESLYREADLQAVAGRQASSNAAGALISTVAYTSAGSVLIGLLVAFFVSRGIDASVHRCVAFAKRVALGDLTARIDDAGRDEFGALANAMNSMTGALRRGHEEQEVQKAKLAEANAVLRAEVIERRRAQDKLYASQRRLKAITDNLFEGVLVVDRSGKVIFANPSAVRLLREGDSGKPVEGGHIDELLLLKRDGQTTPFAEGPWREPAAGGSLVRDDDAVFQIAGGKQMAVGYACSPLRSEGGGCATIISFRNIEALKRAQFEAVQSSRLASVGQLAAGIAHEINTPIQFITDNLRFIGSAWPGVTKVLGEASALAARAVSKTEMTDAAARFAEASAITGIGFLTDEIPNAIAESLEGAAQVANIVGSMKEFAHPGAGAKAAVDINRAIDNALTMSRNTWRQVAEVEKGFDPNLPPVYCNVGEIVQVFLNLIVNAAQAIEESGKAGLGKISISTRSHAGAVEVRVADTGKGISQDIVEKIFDPFFTTKGVGKGTGQGLAICHDVIVNKHGGRIDLVAEKGWGAVFVVRLPARAIADAKSS